jgi:hypothetical protein
VDHKNKTFVRITQYPNQHPTYIELLNYISIDGKEELIAEMNVTELLNQEVKMKSLMDLLNIPPEWKCDALSYNDSKICNCECGAYDPDCDNPNLPVMNCDHFFFNSTGTCSKEGRCVFHIEIPKEWKCNETLYADGKECNCKHYCYLMFSYA